MNKLHKEALKRTCFDLIIASSIIASSLIILCVVILLLTKHFFIASLLAVLVFGLPSLMMLFNANLKEVEKENKRKQK